MLKIGDFVYVHYTPQRVGVVLEVHDMGSYGVIAVGPYKGEDAGPKPSDVTIKFLKGDVVRMSSLGLASFTKLIEDHRRKLRTHEATLKKLEAL